MKFLSGAPLHRYRIDSFFSSRRRHTRCYPDWSSDVCSSDLLGQAVADHIHLAADQIHGHGSLEIAAKGGVSDVPVFPAIGAWVVGPDETAPSHDHPLLDRIP